MFENDWCNDSGERLLFSERENGLMERVKNSLDEKDVDALFGVVHGAVGRGWLAQKFPKTCPDFSGVVCGTNYGGLSQRLKAVICDSINWLNWLNTGVLVGCGLSSLPVDGKKQEVVLDLLEYAGPLLSDVKYGKEHEFFNHRHFIFPEDVCKVVAEFRGEVNTIFRRGGYAYEMGDDLKVKRLVAREAEGQIDELRRGVGDDDLDEMLKQSVGLFLSHRDSERKQGLEKLWDAFERLKSLHSASQGEKKKSIQQLLEPIDSAFREEVNAEMMALTAIGNSFNIRHHENYVKKTSEEAYEYLFVRLSALMRFLLVANGKIREEDSF